MLITVEISMVMVVLEVVLVPAVQEEMQFNLISLLE